MHFLDLLQDGHKVQVILQGSIDSLRKGDIIEVAGTPGRSQTGQLSCKVHNFSLLTPCLTNLPDEKVGLKDAEIRCRARHLDLIANPSSFATFRARSRIIAQIRAFLSARDFMEVETPIISALAGGATAKPFKTTPAASPSTELLLRIAPELYLKRLVIGGFDRVFELGRQFRDEGVDSTHNPEFTSCELYSAYTGLDEMAQMIEQLWFDLVPQGNNLTRTFQKMYIFEELKSKAGLQLRLDESLPEQLKRPEIAHLAQLPEEAPVSRIFDRLVSRFVEPLCQEPTLLFGYPLFTSPLARAELQNPVLAARFELFVAGREVANAYAELNDPQAQLVRFREQARMRTAGDDEIPAADEDFLKALEAGMPPTTGCGLGIDRLVMLLTSSASIRDVIFYPSIW